MRWQKNYKLRAFMEKEKSFASRKEVEKELQKLNIPLLLRKLEDYATYLLYDHDRDKAFDIVGLVFDKIITQDRKWYKGKSLKSTLFQAAKSLCNNENKKLKRKRQKEVQGIEIENLASHKQINQFEKLALEELKSIAVSLLKNHDPPPDYLEELIFECWIEGITKQREVAEYLEQDIKEVRKGVKRLKRKLDPIKDEFIKMEYGQE